MDGQYRGVGISWLPSVTSNAAIMKEVQMSINGTSGDPEGLETSAPDGPSKFHLRHLAFHFHLLAGQYSLFPILHCATLPHLTLISRHLKRPAGDVNSRHSDCFSVSADGTAGATVPRFWAKSVRTL